MNIVRNIAIIVKLYLLYFGMSAYSGAYPFTILGLQSAVRRTK